MSPTIKTCPTRHAAAVLALLAASAASPARAEPQTAAIFPFELDATGPQGAGNDATKLQLLDAQTRDLLAQQGFTAADIAPVAAEAKTSNFRTCDGCDVPLAAKLGANIAVNGWVQKVSNLILNVNMVVREVPSGKILRAGSVDIRGNTDTSWSRGLHYLMQRLYPPKPTS